MTALMRNSEGMVKAPQPLPLLPTLSAGDAERLAYVEASARVLRWHTEPVLHRQSVGEHTYTVMHLVLLLTDGTATKNLLVAALFHDTAEKLFGDIPSPTKSLPELRDILEAAEDAYMTAIGLPIPELTAWEAGVLKMADVLEGGLFCAFETRRGNRDIQRGFANYLNYARRLLEASGPSRNSVAAGIYQQLYQEYQRVFSS